MKAFERALEANPAPARLGDVALRFAPSMLIGETESPRGTWRPQALVAIGLTAVALGVAVLATGSQWMAAALIGAGGACVATSSWLARLERRKRGFVVNFATSTLRLDFTTALAGRPRTLLVPFDQVRGVAVLDQADGFQCLTVEFASGDSMFREVLAAFIGADEDEAAGRLRRVLEGAFGLGAIPPDSPFLAGGETTHEAETTPGSRPSPPASS